MMMNDIGTGILILCCVIAWAMYKWVRGQEWGKPEE